MKDKNVTTSNKSIIKKLKDHNKVNDSLLACIGSLSLEELIGLKFELSAEHINNRLYGFDIWRKTNYIVKDAIMKFAVSTTKSKITTSFTLLTIVCEGFGMLQTNEVSLVTSVPT